MKILWISDHDPHVLGQGGAQLTDYFWATKLKANHFHIEWHKSLSNLEMRGDKYEYHIAVVSNTNHITPEKVKELTYGKKYVCIIHGTLGKEPYAGFYEDANINICMSPSHVKWFRNNYKGVATYSPPYIPNIFDNIKSPNASGHVYIGALHVHKGIDQIVKYAIDNQLEIDCYGDGEHKPLGLNYKKSINYLELPTVLSKYDNFVWFLPRYGSFGRTIAEAKLAGLNFIGNKEAFGVFSYVWDWENPLSIRHELSKNYNNFIQFFS